MGLISEARKPESSSWPLYTFSAITILLGSLVQFASQEIPNTVAESAPRWFDYVFTIASPLGAAAILIALYGVKDLASSLRLEQIGCIVTSVMGISYFIAVFVFVDGFPKAVATWLYGGISIYLLLRVIEIQRTFRHARKVRTGNES